MFRKPSEFEAFERVMVEAHQRQPIRILSYCVLSNHLHFVVWPEADGQVTDFSACAHHPCRPLARIASDGGLRAPVSRPVQELSGSERRPPGWPATICRAESPVGGTG